MKKLIKRALVLAVVGAAASKIYQARPQETTTTPVTPIQ